MSLKSRLAGRPARRSGTGNLHAAEGSLRYLAVSGDRKEALGRSVNDAARGIFIRELDAMLKDGYENKGPTV